MDLEETETLILNVSTNHDKVISTTKCEISKQSSDSNNGRDGLINSNQQIKDNINTSDCIIDDNDSDEDNVSIMDLIKIRSNSICEPNSVNKEIRDKPIELNVSTPSSLNESVIKNILPKKRGRPRKIKTTNPIDLSKTSSGLNLDEVNNSFKKKGLSRKRVSNISIKNEINEDSDVMDEDYNEEYKSSKKRLSPRKRVSNISIKNEISDDSDVMDEYFNEKDNSTKRRRHSGRSGDNFKKAGYLNNLMLFY